MAERSKRIVLYSAEKMEMVNNDTKTLLKRYEIDMKLRELSEKTTILCTF